MNYLLLLLDFHALVEKTCAEHPAVKGQDRESVQKVTEEIILP